MSLCCVCFNDERNNIVLRHSPKIPEVSHYIGFCFATIIWDDKNDNIRFYLQNITQAYVEVAFTIYHLHYKGKSEMTESAHNPFFLRLLTKLLSLLGISSDCCGSKKLSATFFLTCNSNVYSAKPRMVNGFDLKSVMKRTLTTTCNHIGDKRLIKFDESAAKITQPTQ